MKGIILTCDKCGQRYDLRTQLDKSKEGIVRCPRCQNIVGYEKKRRR